MNTLIRTILTMAFGFASVTLQASEPFFDRKSPPVVDYDEENQTWTFGNQRVERVIQYDAEKKGFFTTRWKDLDSGLDLSLAPGVTGRFFLTSGDKKIAIDLSENFVPGQRTWSLQKDTDIKGGGVQTLQIDCEGVGPNEGINITLCYDLYPGDEPWMTKWFKIDAPGLDEANLDSIVFDDFATGTTISSKVHTFGKATSLVLAPANTNPNQFAMLSNLNWNANIRVARGHVSTAMNVNAKLGEYLALTGGKTTKTFEGFSNSSIETAKFTYQVFLVDRFILAEPGISRPFFHGWYGDFDLRRNNSDLMVQDPEFVVKRSKDCGLDVQPVTICAMSGRLWDYDLGWREKRNLHPFLDPENPESLVAIAKREGVKTQFYQGNNGIPTHLGISLCDPEAALDAASWIGEITRRTGTSGWFIEDRAPGVKCTVEGHLHAPGNSMALWQEGFRKMSESVQAANPKAAIGRTWIWNLDVLDVAHWTQPDDQDNSGKAETWARTVVSLIPLQPTLAFKICMGMHWPDTSIAEYESIISRAAMLGPMMFSHHLPDITDEEAAIIRKWSEWHLSNQKWLEYAQTLDAVRSDGTSAFGMMHLRNAHEGKYGYLGYWWNEGQDLTIKIDPAKWMLDMPVDKVAAFSLRTGEELPIITNGSTLQIKASGDWDVIELRIKERQ